MSPLDSNAISGDEFSNKDIEKSLEYEYKEEVHYFIAALPANALKRAHDVASKASDSGGEPQQPYYSLVDIDSDRPMLELEGSIYQGTNDELLGTCLAFDSGSIDTGSQKTCAELVAKASRVITFYEVKVFRK